MIQNEKGYRFITPGSGEDVFVDHSVIQGSGYATLGEGQTVEFELEDTPKGKRAINVVKI